MAWDDDGDRVEADGVGYGADAGAVLAEFGEVAVADEAGLVAVVGQFVELAPDAFLEVGAEEDEVVPCSLVAESPYFIEEDGGGGDFAVGASAVAGEAGADRGEEAVVGRYSRDFTVDSDDDPFPVGFHSDMCYSDKIPGQAWNDVARALCTSSRA